MMGGEVGVESAPGDGSMFWFTVRLDKDKESAVLPAPIFPVEEGLRCLRDGFAGVRVLLAEDEPISQEVARGLLEDAGLAVDIASDGATALEQTRNRPYALILMDMQMPRLNGMDATRAIRADSLNRDTPIIAMTANAFDGDRENCLASGMNEHLAKPVNPGALYAVLLKWLEGRA
jgi:CheY-like chemotaxis protein